MSRATFRRGRVANQGITAAVAEKVACGPDRVNNLESRPAGPTLWAEKVLLFAGRWQSAFNEFGQLENTEFDAVDGMAVVDVVVGAMDWPLKPNSSLLSDSSAIMSVSRSNGVLVGGTRREGGLLSVFRKVSEVLSLACPVCMPDHRRGDWRLLAYKRPS